MINLTCKTCGANSFKEENNSYICQYCNAHFIKIPQHSKKKLTIIIFMLGLIFIAIFMGYKLLDTIQHDIHTLTNDTHSINTKDSTVVYHLYPAHPSSRISSSKNKIWLMKSFLRKNKILDRKMIKELGTFVSQSTEYNINYSYANRPKNGYNNYDFYRGSAYRGMSQSSMYASASIANLISKIKLDIENGDCKKWSANTHGGNLNRNDNFWTNFCPKPNIVTYLKQLL